MKLTLHIWRQKSPNHVGRMVQYEHTNVNPHMSFLEMLDVLTEDLVARGEGRFVFDRARREGIRGSCGLMITGVARGPQPAKTVCQLHLRDLKEGDVLCLEPGREKAFPPVKDLV